MSLPSNSNPMTPLLGRTDSVVMNRNKSLQLRILKTACITVLVFAAIIGIIKLSSSNSNPENHDANNNPIPPGVLRLSSGISEDLQNVDSKKWRKISITEGLPSAYLELDVDDLIGESEGEAVDELVLKYVTFNPETITEALHADVFHNLKKIRMERVKILNSNSGNSSWNFHRVNLPKLTNFELDVDMGLGFHDQYTDYMKEITEEGLIGMLFYDKEQSPTVSTDLGEKLVNDGVQVTIRVFGWTVISFKKSDDDGLTATNGWEVILGVEFAEKLLNTFMQKNLAINHLTMTECVVSMKAFPRSLQYLNLYRVTIKDGDILGYFQSLESGASGLTELYIELRNATLKLSKVPKTVKTLAIGDIVDAQYTLGDTVGAETVGLGFPLDNQIIENFHQIFPTVKNIGIFQPTDGIQHLLLSNILKTNASWVLMEGFERKSTKLANITKVEKEMEHVLENCGVAPGESNFLIYKDMRTFSWYEMNLDKAKSLKFRYDILGWNEYISWDIFSANF